MDLRFCRLDSGHLFCIIMNAAAASSILLLLQLLLFLFPLWLYC
jgi:hypothetical protein